MQRDESANAEIIGVVILIGIFAVTAGIISATVFAAPQPTKVPAASIEITKPSETSIHIAHIGGDPLPLEHLVVRWSKIGGATGSIEGFDELKSLFTLPSDKSALDNGFSEELSTDWDAIVLNWKGDAGESVIAIWDPLGLSPSEAGDPFTPGVQWTPHAQPTPTPLPVPIVEKLSAGFAVPESLTVGESFTFTSTEAGATSFLWIFGDGTTSTQMTQAHSFTREGTYSVSLTVSNTMTSDTVVHAIVVDPGLPDEPLYFQVFPTVGSKELEVNCTDLTHIDQTLWQWTFTDGLTHVVTRTEKLVASAGSSYKFTFRNPSGIVDNICTIGLTVWSPYVSGPIVFEEQTVCVAPPLQAIFSPDVLVGTFPQTVTFTDESAGLISSWFWDFGDGQTSTEQHPVHTFDILPKELREIRTYTVRLTITGPDGETSTTTRDITIYPPVVADFTADPTQGEPPLTVSFTDASTGGATSWEWDFGDNGISNAQNPVHEFTEAGTYSVTLIATRSTPDAPHSADIMTKEIFIRVGPAVTAEFTATPTIGAGSLDVQFTDLSTSTDPAFAPILSWSWNFGDGSPVVQGTDPTIHKNPMHTYTAAGTYAVSLTAANKFRENTMTKTGYITVHPTVVASFTGNPTAVPVGDSVAFTDTSSGSPTSWSWNFGDGQTSTDRHPTHTYTAKGSYPVTLTAGNGYHSATIISTDYIRVFEPVTAAFTATPLEGPVSLPVTFTDASTGDVDAWSWNFDDGTTDSVKNPTAHTYADARDYVVTLTAWNQLRPELTSTSSATIRAYSTPTASFMTDTLTGAATLTVTFSDTSTGNPFSWSWDFGDGQTSTEKSPSHTYANTDTYTVTLTVVNPAGTSTATQAITVS